MLRIGVLGAGEWGLNHVRVTEAEPQCELVAVADPDPATEARVHRIAPRARFVRDVDTLLAATDIDAVIIASPVQTHVPLATAAFAAGKHALVEKPIATSATEALSLCAAARRARRVGMVGHLMLHHPAVARVRELLVSGELGKLHYLHSTRVNLGRFRHEENALWSFGPHDLSMFHFLTGELPRTVSARGQCVLQPDIEDVVFLTVRYRGGEIGNVHLSWLNPRKERRLTLVCSRKMVEFDDVDRAKLRIFDKGYDRPPGFSEYAQYLTIRDGDVHIPHLEMQEPLLLQLRHFLECIRQGTEPVASLVSAVRVTAVLEAAQRSLHADGIPVQVLDPLEDFEG